MVYSPNALVVMVKYPQPGQTKTRLSPPLSLDQAAALYECFLLDTFAFMREVPDSQACAAFSPPAAEGYFSTLAPDFDLLIQAGENLGQRLNAALKTYLDRGFQKVLLLDSDSPTLPAAYLTEALNLLDTYPVVVGPSADGGYYLIGATRHIPELLQQVPMSTPTVLKDTVLLANQLGIKVGSLPAWYDVDDGPGLERLCRELRASAAASAARRTRLWLVENGWLKD